MKSSALATTSKLLRKETNLLPAATKKEEGKEEKEEGSFAPLAQVFVYGERETFRVAHDAAAGRRVVAARDLKPGELVLDEPPFAKVMCTIQ